MDNERYQALRLAFYYQQPFRDFVVDFGHPRDFATLELWWTEIERVKQLEAQTP